MKNSNFIKSCRSLKNKKPFYIEKNFFDLVRTKKATVETYNAIIMLFNKLKKYDISEKYVNKFNSSKLHPDKFTFTAMILTYGMQEKFSKAKNILEKLKQSKADYKSLSIGYNNLIIGLGAYKKTPEIIKVFEEFKNLTNPNYPDNFIYTTLINALGNCQAIGAIKKYIKEVENNFEFLKKSNRSSSFLKKFKVSAALYNATLKSLGKISFKEANEFFNKLTNYKVKVDEITNHSWLKILCDNNKLKQANIFFQTIQKPSKRTYTILIEGYAKQAKFKNAIKLANKMVEKLGFYIVPYNILIQNLGKYKKIQQAEQIFNKISTNKLDIVTYVNIINAYFNSGNVKKGLNYFNKMEKNPNITTTIKEQTNLIKHLINNGNFNLAKKYFKKCKPNRYTYSIIIKGFCDYDHNISLQYFKKFKQDFKPNRHIYNTIIDVLCKKQKFKQAFSYFKELQKEKLNPNYVTASVMLLPMSKANLKKEVTEIIKKCDNLKLDKYSNELNHIIIKSLVNIGSITKSISRCNKLSKINKANSVYLNITLITALILNNKTKLAFKRFREINSKNLNVGMYTKIIHAFSLIEDSNNAVKIFNELEKNKNIKIDIAAYTSLLQALLKNDKLELAIKYLQKCLDSKIKPDLKLYNDIIEQLAKQGKFKETITIYNNLLSLKIKPNLQIFQSIIAVSSRVGKFDEAIKFLEQLEKNKYVKMNTHAFNQAISIYAELRNKDKALKYFKQIEKNKLEPDRVSYCILIKAFGLSGDIKSALKIFLDLKKHHTLDVACFGQIISSLISNNKIDLAIDHYSEMLRLKIKPDEEILANMVRVYGIKNQLKTSKVLFDKIEKNFNHPSIHSISIIVGSCGINKDYNGALYYFKKFQKIDHYKKINQEILYCNLIKALLLSGKTDMAIKYFDELKSKHHNLSITSYSNIIEGLIHNREFELAVNYYLEVKSLGLKIDAIYTSSAIRVLCNYGRFDEAIQIFEHLKKTPTKPNKYHYNILINQLNNHGRLKESMSYLKEMQSTLKFNKDGFYYTTVLHVLFKQNINTAISFFNKKINYKKNNIVIYNQYLSLLFKYGELKKAIACHKKMIENRIRPDLYTYSIMINHLSKSGMFNKAEKLITLLLEKKINNKKLSLDTTTINSIIGAYGQSGLLDKSLDLFNSIIKREFVEVYPDATTYNTIIYILGINGRLDKALEIYQKLKNPSLKINPDNATYSILIKICDHNDRIGFLLEELKKIPNNNLDIMNHNDLLKSLHKNKLTKEFDKYFSKLNNFSKFRIDVINALIQNISHFDNISIREYLKNIELKFQPNTETYNNFIKVFGEIGDIDGVEYTFNKLKKNHKLRPNELTFIRMIKAYVCNGMFSKSSEIFNTCILEQTNNTMRLYSKYIKYLANCYDKENLIKLLNKIQPGKYFLKDHNKKKNYLDKNADIDFHNNIIFAFSRLNKFEQAYDYYKKLIKSKLFNPNLVTYNNALYAKVIHAIQTKNFKYINDSKMLFGNLIKDKKFNVKTFNIMFKMSRVLGQKYFKYLSKLFKEHKLTPDKTTKIYLNKYFNLKNKDYNVKINYIRYKDPLNDLATQLTNLDGKFKIYVHGKSSRDLYYKNTKKILSNNKVGVIVDCPPYILEDLLLVNEFKIKFLRVDYSKLNWPVYLLATDKNDNNVFEFSFARSLLTKYDIVNYLKNSDFYLNNIFYDPVTNKFLDFEKVCFDKKSHNYKFMQEFKHCIQNKVVTIFDKNSYQCNHNLIINMMLLLQDKGLTLNSAEISHIKKAMENVNKINISKPIFEKLFLPKNSNTRDVVIKMNHFFPGILNKLFLKNQDKTLSHDVWERIFKKYNFKSYADLFNNITNKKCTKIIGYNDFNDNIKGYFDNSLNKNTDKKSFKSKRTNKSSIAVLEIV